VPVDGPGTCGVVSLCFHTAGPSWLSRLLFTATAVMWVGIAVVLVARLPADPGRWVAEARVPSVLTLVAGTAVLGSRVAGAGRTGFSEGLLVIGAVLGATLLWPVLGHWSTPTVGTSFLVCVAPQALAVLVAQLARGTGERWEMYVAGAAFVLGLVLYGVVVGRFDFAQLVRGEGDQWVLGGALAISTLAGATLLDVSARLGAADTARTALHVLTPILGWAAAVAYVALAAAEAVRPRLRFDPRRWSTVFPLGMAALASLEYGGPAGAGTTRDRGGDRAGERTTNWFARMSEGPAMMFGVNRDL
jgi:hypothetical protein